MFVELLGRLSHLLDTPLFLLLIAGALDGTGQGESGEILPVALDQHLRAGSGEEGSAQVCGELHTVTITMARKIDHARTYQQGIHAFGELNIRVAGQHHLLQLGGGNGFNCCGNDVGVRDGVGRKRNVTDGKAAVITAVSSGRLQWPFGAPDLFRDGERGGFIEVERHAAHHHLGARCLAGHEVADVGGGIVGAAEFFPGSLRADAAMGPRQQKVRRGAEPAG